MAWSTTSVILGWLVAMFAGSFMGVALESLWNRTSGLGAASAIVSVQAATGGEPRFTRLLFWQTTVIQIPLWLTMLAVAWLLTKRHNLGFRNGLALQHRLVDIPVGVAAGFLTQLALLRLIYWPLFRFDVVDPEDLSAPARNLVSSAGGVSGAVLLVVVLVLVVAFVEEVFFRGLLLRSVWSRIGTFPSVLISSALFALAHPQSNILVYLYQLPALMTFGMISSVLVVKFGRLGPALWAHAAFNCYTVIVLLR